MNGRRVEVTRDEAFSFLAGLSEHLTWTSVSYEYNGVFLACIRCHGICTGEQLYTHRVCLTRTLTVRSSQIGGSGSHSICFSH